MGLKGQSHRGANGRDSGRQTEKKGDERRGKRRQWECMFHSRNKRLYELTTIFEERARAHKSERRRFTRGHRTMSCLSILSHPFSKMKSFQREKTTPLSRFVPFRTGFVQRCTTLQLLFDSNLAIIPLTFGSINLDHFQQWNNIFLLFINVSNRLNRLDCGAIRTSNGYWWSLYWN